jgi:hypothetical protein
MALELTTPPYEVRCEACKCSFAVGTKQCVHCGARLGTGIDAAWLRAAAGAGRADEGAPEATGPWIGKILLYAGAGVLAVVAQALRNCSDQ